MFTYYLNFSNFSRYLGIQLLIYIFQDKDIKTRDENGRLLGKLGDGSFGIVCKGQWVTRNFLKGFLDQSKNPKWRVSIYFHSSFFS